MKTLKLSVALSLASLSVAASAQFLTAQVGQHTYDANIVSTHDHYNSRQEAVGPLTVDDTTAFDTNSSTFTGIGRVTADYGTLALFARSEVSNQWDGAYFQSATAEGIFFDPLTIAGGTAGASFQASMTLKAVQSAGGPLGVAYGYGVRLDFFRFDESTGNWDNLTGQSGTYDDHTVGSQIDVTATNTLVDYDPTRRYAISAYGHLSAQYQSNPDMSEPLVWNEVDGEHTAVLTGIGFKTGPVGSFVGASGHVYPNPVPEPASFLALGAGLAALRRRQR